MACSETTLTGRNGKVVVESTLVARITKWTVSPKLASSSEWGDSNTEGYTARTPGRRDCTFSIEGKYDTDDDVLDLFAEGDRAVVTLWMDATALYWDFPCAICSDFSMTIDVDTEEVTGWTSNWGADGKYYRPGEAGAATRTLPS